MLNFKNQSGFIALTSTIIIVLILVTITVIVSLSGFLGRFNILDKEFKEKSASLAEACVEVAIIRIIGSPSYSPTNECVPISDSCPSGSNTCTIVSVESNTPTTGQTFIKARAVFSEATTNLGVAIDSTTYGIVSWQECADPC